MAIKTSKVQHTHELEQHEYYCDKCDIYLGKSTENYEGFIFQGREKGEFEHKIYINNWWRLKATLCDVCRDKLVSGLETALKALGYVCD